MLGSCPEEVGDDPADRSTHLAHAMPTHITGHDPLRVLRRWESPWQKSKEHRVPFNKSVYLHDHILTDYKFGAAEEIDKLKEERNIK